LLPEEAQIGGSWTRLAKKSWQNGSSDRGRALPSNHRPKSNLPIPPEKKKKPKKSSGMCCDFVFIFK
jgi:hypothetical protein